MLPGSSRTTLSSIRWAREFWFRSAASAARSTLTSSSGFNVLAELSRFEAVAASDGVTGPDCETMLVAAETSCACLAPSRNQAISKVPSPKMAKRLARIRGLFPVSGRPVAANG